MSKSKVIYYHGTDAESARRILKEGFKTNTYFAYHLEDAIGYGGSHVFGVVFSNHRDTETWQFVTKKRVLSNRIVFYRVFEVREVMLDQSLRQEVFESNLPQEERPLARKEFEMEQAGIPLKERMKRMRKLWKDFHKEEQEKSD